ncbi:MAG TPA: glycosyltransferase family 39 protein [Thermoanaerobaculia bacterium]|nr:glycosyltransferase family 39 protein [Thermoanaerobaculia bacterium]
MGVSATVAALAKGDPQHAPLFFAGARAWAGAFGSAIASVRTLSGVLGLLLLPGVFLLSRQLFSDRRVAALATLFVALSPYHVFYAREARPYSLLACAAVWSSVLLLRAEHRRGAWHWALYGATVAVGLYSHLLFALVLLAQCLHVTIRWARGTNDPPGRRSLALRFGVAAGAAVLSFLPWGIVVWTNMPTVRQQLAWMSNPVEAPFRLVGMWAFNYSSPFFDVGDAGALADGLELADAFGYLARAGILVVSLLGVVHVARGRHVCRGRVLLLGLIGLPFLAVAAPDLLFGGRRSGIGAQYLGVSFLGVQLAVAALLCWLDLRSGWRRRAAGAVIVSLLVLSMASAGLVATAESWWLAPEFNFNRRVAGLVNAHERPLAIQLVDAILLSLAHHYSPEVTVLPVAEGDVVELPEGFDQTFVLRPLDDELSRQGGLVVEPTDVHGLATVRRVSVARSRWPRPVLGTRIRERGLAVLSFRHADP